MMTKDKKKVEPSPKPIQENEAGIGVKTNKPSRVRSVLSFLLVVAGLLLIAVPMIITKLNASRNDDIIAQFLMEAEQAAAQSEALAGENVEDFYDNNVDLSAELSQSTSDSSSQENQTPEPDSSAEPTDTAPAAPTKKPLMSKEEIQKRMTGVLTIDKIDLKMVIMDGVDEETLRVAAGRMPETGNFDEVGNCVLAGHRSYTFDKYFNRLDELEPGDKIVVQTKTKTLTYEIYEKKIVEPNDFSITKGNGTDKILTLFTCHPVMIASHRLVVHAKQIE